MISRRNSLILSSGVLLCSIVLTESKPLLTDKSSEVNKDSPDSSSTSPSTLGYTMRSSEQKYQSHILDTGQKQIAPVSNYSDSTFLTSYAVFQQIPAKESSVSSGKSSQPKESSKLRIKRNKTRIRYRKKDRTRDNDY